MTNTPQKRTRPLYKAQDVKTAATGRWCDKPERFRLDGIISADHPAAWLNSESGERVSCGGGYAVVDFGAHGKWRLPARYVIPSRHRRTLQLLDQVADDATVVGDDGDDAEKKEGGASHGNN